MRYVLKLNKLYFLVSVCIKWVIAYAFNRFKKKEKPIHILFCLVDHFEPSHGGLGADVEKKRMNELSDRYPKLANKHKDYFGNIPNRTWFFHAYDHRNGNLRKLVSLCEKGYGEIELHLHHGKTQPDTSENLKKTLEQCIIEFGEFGIFGTQNGQKKYGFIHGDWALDNSRNGKYCGVNNEISILDQTGCYADFTFPCLNEANPKQINSIYYAKDDPCKAKSHDSGAPVRRNGGKEGDLMIVQGPLHPFFFSKNITSLRNPNDAINGDPRICNRRVDSWIKTGIHVKGTPNWVVVKTHTHGASYSEAVLGEEMDEIFSYLEEKYNDGKRYQLHYVTSRELYNIIKSVESGEVISNPEEYRDYLIEKPFYDSSPEINESSEILQGLINKTYRG